MPTYAKTLLVILQNSHKKSSNRTFVNTIFVQYLFFKHTLADFPIGIERILFMKRRLGLMCLIGLLAVGCGTDSSTTEGLQSVEMTTEETESNQEQEAYVLNFTGTTIDGKTLTSDCFADSKLTVINVWATYCNPCLSEMPDLGEIAREYNTTEMQMLGIICDVTEGADKKEAQDLIEQTKANYPHLLLNQELYENLVVASDSVPTTYFFNQKGELLGYLVGARSKQAWEEVINGLLEQME